MGHQYRQIITCLYSPDFKSNKAGTRLYLSLNSVIPLKPLNEFWHTLSDRCLGSVAQFFHSSVDIRICRLNISRLHTYYIYPLPIFPFKTHLLDYTQWAKKTEWLGYARCLL